MARYNEILVGRFNRGLQKTTGIKAEPPSPQLASEIQPTLPIRLEVDFRYLLSVHTFARFVVIGAVAAQFGDLRLRNPVGSNVVGTIIKAQMWEGVTDSFGVFHYGGNTVDLATNLSVIGGAERLDSRGAQVPNLNLSQGTIASASPGGSIRVLSPAALANTTLDMILTPEQHIPLLPGDTFDLVGGTANTAVNAAIWWLERFLEDSERT